MEDSETQKRIIELGKFLVKELELEPGVDTLGRWMAHFIAELIERSEAADGKDKTQLEKRCFETILKFWGHRTSLPHGICPFENFEPIYEFIKRLSPGKDDYFYFEPPPNPTEEENEVKKWVQVASKIDTSARIWIKFALRMAARSATSEKTIRWFKKSGFLNPPDTTIARLLLEYDFENFIGFANSPSLNTDKKIIQQRIRDLKSIQRFNRELISFLEKELESASDEEPPPTPGDIYA